MSNLIWIQFLSKGTIRTDEAGQSLTGQNALAFL
jgi:hypothetical protein